MNALLASLLRFGYADLALVVVVAVIVFLATSTRRVGHRCRRCREINRHGAVYCAQCGTRLASK